MEPEYQDDPSVSSQARLLRRLHPDFVCYGLPEGSIFKPDSTAGAIGTSVTLWESDQDLTNVLAGWENFGVVVVTMGECREAGLGIVRMALPDNPHHCELFGPSAKKKRRALSKGARWVKYPDGYPEQLKGPLETLRTGPHATSTEQTAPPCDPEELP